MHTDCAQLVFVLPKHNKHNAHTRRTASNCEPRLCTVVLFVLPSNCIQLSKCGAKCKLFISNISWQIQIQMVSMAKQNTKRCCDVLSMFVLSKWQFWNMFGAPDTLTLLNAHTFLLIFVLWSKKVRLTVAKCTHRCAAAPREWHTLSLGRNKHGHNNSAPKRQKEIKILGKLF